MLTVGDFERLAQVRVWRDSKPEVPFTAKTPRLWSTQRPDELMTAFRGADCVEDALGKPLTVDAALARFQAAAGYLPEWAVGAKATDITFVVTRE